MKTGPKVWQYKGLLIHDFRRSFLWRKFVSYSIFRVSSRGCCTALIGSLELLLHLRVSCWGSS